jgi:hypothetical protein
MCLTIPSRLAMEAIHDTLAASESAQIFWWFEWELRRDQHRRLAIAKFDLAFREMNHGCA